MAHGLVRVRGDRYEYNVGAAFAAAHGLEVIDSPTHFRDGKPRGATRLNDRPVKPRKSLKALKNSDADASAEAASSADDINNPSPEEN